MRYIFMRNVCNNVPLFCLWRGCGAVLSWLVPVRSNKQKTKKRKIEGLVPYYVALRHLQPKFISEKATCVEHTVADTQTQVLVQGEKV